MTKPSKFILTTDFPTLKNDDTQAGQLVLPGSLTVASGGNVTGTGDVTMGQLGAVIRGRIASTKNSDIFYSGQAIVFDRVGTFAGSPAPYPMACFMYRISATVVRFVVYIPNPYGGTLTLEAGTDTITLQANTFITPFT